MLARYRAFLRFKEAVEDWLEPGRTAQKFERGSGFAGHRRRRRAWAPAANLRTFTFPRPRSQDGSLRPASAKCLGLTHVEHPMPAAFPQLHFTWHR